MVVDDEKYFTILHTTLTDMDGSWTDDVENTPNTVKYKAIGKFEPRVLVWCSIYKADVSTPFIDGTFKGQAVDADV
jgi:hypothetical protein